MAKSKQTASSAKPSRSARKGAPPSKKGAPKPARQGRRAATAPKAKRRGTKQARVITLLRRDTGASLRELIAATGWLPHTTRAALTGLRHKGFVLDRASARTARRSIGSAALSGFKSVQSGLSPWLTRTLTLEDEIACLRGLDLVGLQARWRTMFGRRAPAHLPKHLLLRIMAYRLRPTCTATWTGRASALSTGWPRLAGQVRAAAAGRLRQARHPAGPRVGWGAPSRDGSR